MNKNAKNYLWLASSALSAMMAWAAYLAVQNYAQAIAYQFAPEYTPMSRAEILNIYSGYYWEGCTAEQLRAPNNRCSWDELRHSSEVKLVSLKESMRRYEFEEQHVNGTAESISNVAGVIFGGVMIIACGSILLILFSQREFMQAGLKKIIARLPLKGLIARGNVKIAEAEYRKIKRLFEHGLISRDEYEKRKAVLIASIGANLR